MRSDWACMLCIDESNPQLTEQVALKSRQHVLASHDTPNKLSALLRLPMLVQYLISCKQGGDVPQNDELLAVAVEAHCYQMTPGWGQVQADHPS